MTDDQILQIVKKCFTEEWCEEDGCGWTEFAGKPDVFVKFAQEIRKQTIDEVLTLIKDVPNPEAHWTAIKRILDKYYD